jgi:hypothetical protein
VKDFALKLLDVLFKNFVHVVFGVMILVIAGLAWSMLKQKADLDRAKTDLVGQKDAYAQLSSTYAKLETDYVDQKKLAADAKAKWQAELATNKQLKDQLRGIASTTFSVGSFPQTGKPDQLVPGDGGYLYQEVAFVDEKGKVGPPVGFVKVENGTGKVTSKVFNHDVDIESAITVDDKTGKVGVYSRGFYILREPSLADSDPESGKSSWKDVPFPLKITGGTLTFDPLNPSVPTTIPNRLMWAAHLNVGTFAGMTTTGVAWGTHGDITFAGWGKTKNDLDFKMLGVGLNGNKGYLDVNVVPAYWRIANVLPLVSNVYIGAGAGFGTSGTDYFLTVGGTL